MSASPLGAPQAVGRSSRELQRERTLSTASEGGGSSDRLSSALRICLCCLCEKSNLFTFGEAWIPSGFDSLKLSEAFYVHSNSDKDFRRWRDVSKSIKFRVDKGLPGRCLTRDGGPEWITDVREETSDRFLRIDAAKELGLGAAVSIPIFSDSFNRSGTIVAILCLFAEQAADPDQGLLDELISLVTAMLATEWFRSTFVDVPGMFPLSSNMQQLSLQSATQGKQLQQASTAESPAHPPTTLPDKPRILIVSRRLLRKGKWVDFIGEYHLDLIFRFGAIPVVVPRVAGTLDNIDRYEPMHGLLMIEGEDIDPKFFASTSYDTLSPHAKAKMGEIHKADMDTDIIKDEIEMELSRRCLMRGAPIFGICRGCQLLNHVCGGSLYQDVMLQKGSNLMHIDYANYDSYRHPIRIERNTPLFDWFGQEHLMVNSYHHQGVKRLAPSFKPMAFAPDGLIEGFYDPTHPFRIGLQFHPERMMNEHPGCVRPFQAFVNATKGYMVKIASMGVHTSHFKPSKWPAGDRVASDSLSPQ